MGLITRKFLGWERPLLDLATEKLTQDQGLTDEVLDFSKLIFFLPTSQSCRRFRMNITRNAAADNAVVFPGKITTLTSLISRIEDEDGVVNSATSFMLWVEVLKAANIADLNSLFPLEIENRNEIRWRIGLAEKLFGLQNRLGEAGLTITDVAEKDVEEIDRWQDLATLEKAYLDALENNGLTELNRAKAAFDSFAFSGIEKIVVAGVPDPIPLLLDKLKLISANTPVEIWIHAPESESDKFDEIGRPIAQYWEDAHIDIPNESWIHLEGTSRQQGEEVVDILSSLCTPDNSLDAADFALCSANEELFSDISYALFKQGVAVYNPSGTKMDKMSVYHLLNSFFSLIMKKDFESVSLLIRNPDYLRYFIRKSGAENILEIFTEVDKYLPDHLSTPISSLPEFENPIINTLVNEMTQLIKEFNSGSFFDFIRRFLSDTYNSLEFSPHTREEDKIFCSAASNVDTLLKELHCPIAEKMNKTELLEVFIKLLSKKTVYPEQNEDSIDLHGWLEMPWENAPNIIIAGMNEGWLPESVVGDVFLPDSMLSQLGLNDNRKRFARDTYILHSLLRSRTNGTVNIIVGKQNKNSDPLKPSRLLFKCDKEKLIERSEHLFADAPEDMLDKEKSLPFWKLTKPEFNKEVKRISVTEFRNYLACPFRFYLQKCLKMDDVTYENNEMDAREFGNITHGVLEDFGKCTEMNECSDPGAIKEFLDKTVDAHFNLKFGPKAERPLPILVQYESLKQRLAKFAEIQAQQVVEGWKISGTEIKIIGNIKGIDISGKIDRVEVNSRNGRIRILDYKTVDSSQINRLSPEKVHIKNANNIVPECAVFEYEGKNKCWIDLQLPLYAILLQKNSEYTGKDLECGYFNLHKTITHTDIYLWESMNTYLEAAESCLEKVLDNINNKVFWPPSEKVTYEHFERIYAGYKTMQEAFN